jgi:hypothetical protein
MYGGMISVLAVHRLFVSGPVDALVGNIGYRPLYLDAQIWSVVRLVPAILTGSCATHTSRTIPPCQWSVPDTAGTAAA